MDSKLRTCNGGIFLEERKEFHAEAGNILNKMKKLIKEAASGSAGKEESIRGEE